MTDVHISDRNHQLELLTEYINVRRELIHPCISPTCRLHKRSAGFYEAVKVCVVMATAIKGYSLFGGSIRPALAPLPAYFTPFATFVVP